MFVAKFEKADAENLLLITGDQLKESLADISALTKVLAEAD